MYIYVISVCDPHQCSSTDDFDMLSLSTATALTVSNVTTALAGIPWRKVGERILGLPRSKCDEISSQCSTDEERVGALVREWMLRDPLASWRRICDQIYDTSDWSVDVDDVVADRILHYAEELTGMYCIIVESIQWLHSS